MFQKNKAHLVFRKMKISYPLIRTRTRAYHEVRNVHFSANFACFVFVKDPFGDSPFYLITNEMIDLLTIAELYMKNSEKLKNVYHRQV